MMRRLAARLVVLGTIVTAMSGCTYALAAPTPPDPRFARDRLSQLTSGMGQDAVRALLGEPDRPAGALPTWTYEHVGQQMTCHTIVFGMTLADDATFREQVVLRFGPDGLESASYTLADRQRTRRRDLLARVQVMAPEGTK